MSFHNFKILPKVSRRSCHSQKLPTLKKSYTHFSSIFYISKISINNSSIIFWDNSAQRKELNDSSSNLIKLNPTMKAKNTILQLLFLITIILPFIITQTVTSASKPKTSIKLTEAETWIKAYITSLEFQDLPIKTQTDSDISAHKTTLIDSLLHHTTMLKKPPYIELFENNIKIFTLITPTTLPHISSPEPLAHGASCNPTDHIDQDPKEILDENKEESQFYPKLQDWQNLMLNTSNPQIHICNVHLGLYCSPTTSVCTCRDGTEWVDPPGKCYIPPEEKCTLRDFNIHGVFEDLIDPDFIKWFIRLLIHPINHPICGKGLYCDTFVEGKSPICYCWDKTTRSGCNGKDTWEVLEPMEQKLRKLFIPLDKECNLPNQDIHDIIEALDRYSEDPTIVTVPVSELIQDLVDANTPICNFERGEFCNKGFNPPSCKKRCPHKGETHDENNTCKLNQGELCTRIDKLDDTPDETDCVKNALCKRVQDIKKANKFVLACICSQTEDSIKSMNPIKSFWYGRACDQKPKLFWLKNLIPYQSGLHGEEYLEHEELFQSQVKEVDDLMTLSEGAACDSSQDEDALKFINYFSEKEIKEKEYVNVSKALDKLSAANKPICNYKMFLKCTSDPSSTTSTCVKMDKEVIFNEKTRQLNFPPGAVCNEPIRTSIPKIFYQNYDLDSDNSEPVRNGGIGCIEGAYCVTDYSRPLEDTKDFRGKTVPKKHCRCRKGFTGSDCNKKEDPPREYAAKEKEKLTQVIKLFKEKSTRDYNALCDYNLENKFPKNPSLSNETTDLYELIYILEPKLTTVDPLGVEEGLDFCNGTAYLRCVEKKLHPLKRSSETVAVCDCMKGFERVKRAGGMDGCLVSDGEKCGESWSPTLSSSSKFSAIGPGCASERCIRINGSFRCAEDTHFLYFVPFEKNQALVIVPNTIIFVVVLSLFI